MADEYSQLIDATIRHLETLKARGTQFIEVSPQALEVLSQLPRARAAAPLPGPTPRGPIPKPTPERQIVPPLFSIETVSSANPAPTNTVESSSLELSPEAKAAAFAELRQRVLGCVKCAHLASSRKNVVFGVGNINAQLMFVGEAPGADEDEQGEPFVGRAGQLLTKIIETMGLKRESVYIANILKCRPDTPGQSAGNRKPTPDEMQTCIPFLHEQIDLIRPKVLVALGGTAMEGLLGKPAGIMRLRGNWHAYRGIPLMPTYHPAYVLRNQALSEKRKVWEDMLQVMERLDLPINEKQRSFFLKA